MKGLNPYLFFNGSCKNAMEFYQKALGGDLQMLTVAQAKQEMFAGADQNLIMHAILTSPVIRLMASDNMKQDTKAGDNVCLIIDCSSKEELDKLYAALSKGGDADMKPSVQFWGAYFGSLTDAFGINWMFNYAEECSG